MFVKKYYLEQYIIKVIYAIHFFFLQMWFVQVTSGVSDQVNFLETTY